MMSLTLFSAFLLSQSPLSPSLRQLADRAHVNLGAAIDSLTIQRNADDGRYAEVAAQAANFIEPANDLKPPALWQGEGKYSFENADFLLGAPGQEGWVQKHHLRARGHVLVYASDQGYTIPRWLLAKESQITPEHAKEMLRDYIHTVAGRYKGKIAMWDVINEAVDEAPNKRPFNLRDSFWFRKLGPDFLVLAFQFAHEADPKAHLYYNDYNIEAGGPKAEAVFSLLEFLKSKHAPINGLGLQYHLRLGNAVSKGDGHYQILDRIKKLNLTFMITEFDVGIPVVSYPRTDPQFGLVPKNPSDIEAQANVYRGVFDMALSYKNCEGIQTWGFADRYSWIQQFFAGFGAALQLDGEFKPKPAAFQIAEALQNHRR